MDNCKNFKDLILTDYIDGQLDIALKEQVESHLHQCASCQSFAREVKENLIVPFEKASHQEVPSYLWRQIQEKIYEESSSRLGVLDVMRGWIKGITFPRLVPVFCSFMMFFLIGTTFLYNQQAKLAQDQERGSYLAFILTSSTAVSPVGGNDLGTPIEKYFL